MARIRNGFSACALLALTAVSFASAVQVYLSALPAAEASESLDIGTWLAKADAQAEYPSRRLALARRLEQELRDGYDIEQDYARLGAAEQERYRTNLAALIRVLFQEKVDRYYTLPPGERIAYLDSQIDAVMSWPIAMVRQRKMPGVVAAPDGLLELSQRWYQEADPAERERLAGFANALYQRWMARALGRGQVE